MLMLKLFGLLLSVVVIVTDASPIARIYVKFVQHPHVEEHGITTDGNRILTQQSYLSIGKSSSISRIPYSPVGEHYIKSLIQPIYGVPQMAAYVPIQQNDIGLDTQRNNHISPDFSNGLDYPDPLLITGDDAMLAVKYLYGRGELFFHEIPHSRALLRNQDERRKNGLNGNILRSLRLNSPWMYEIALPRIQSKLNN